MPFYSQLRIRDEDFPKDGDTASQITRKKERRVEKKRISRKILELREALRKHIKNGESKECPEDCINHDGVRYIRLATWNIREFDSAKYGKRAEESFYYIAEIISNFDLVAIQEVKQDLAALHRVMKILGPNWTYISTDVTEGTRGFHERMVYVYNRSKVWFRNIAGELVLSKDIKDIKVVERVQLGPLLNLELPEGQVLESPSEVLIKKYRGKDQLAEELAIQLPEGTWVQLPKGCQVILPYGYGVTVNSDNSIELPQDSLVSIEEDGGQRKRPCLQIPAKSIVDDELQFARTPSLVAFQCGWLKINLCSVHIYYGSGKKGLALRQEEIRRLTQFLSERARRDNQDERDTFYIVMGDFNIISKDHETMEALNSNGFKVPKALWKLPAGSNVRRDKAYDQIAYWAPEEEVESQQGGYTKFEVHRAGIFDFFKTVYRTDDDDPDGKDQKFYTKRFKKSKAYKPSWDSRYKDWRTYQMSDHLPMWVELRVEFGDEYLKLICDNEDHTTDE